VNPGMLRALWSYRGLVTGLVRRDLRVRSLRALWGGAWLVIGPAIQIAIYTLVFSQVLAARLPGVDDPLAYGFFLCAGILPWAFFTELVTRAQTLFLEHAPLLKAVRFPRSTLPAALLGTGLVNFAIPVAILLLVLAATGRWPGAALLAALPVLAVWAALALGLGILTGTLNVFFRDVGYAVGIALQFWFWLTPIVYPASIVPPAVRSALAWNPLTPLVVALQGIVVQGVWPAWGTLVAPAAVAALLALAGWGAFVALSADLVDEL
jgi:lipopolysaccharide transport system permease protein